MGNAGSIRRLRKRREKLVTQALMAIKEIRLIDAALEAEARLEKETVALSEAIKNGARLLNEAARII